jgi:hypothetical protein
LGSKFGDDRKRNDRLLARSPANVAHEFNREATRIFGFALKDFPSQAAGLDPQVPIGVIADVAAIDERWTTGTKQ